MKKFFLYLIFSSISLFAFTQTLNVSASPQTICKNESSTLSANLVGCSSNVLYAWQNPISNSNSIEVSPNVNTQYNVTAYCLIGTELVTKGNFSNINISSPPFTSNYTANNPNTLEGQYYIGVSPSTWNSGMSNILQHSTLGNSYDMMIINGSPTANAIVWEQPISGLIANKKYAFSIWVHSLNDLGDNYADLSFKIGNTKFTSAIKGKSLADGWQQFFIIWTSGNSSTATISIVNENTIALGNDFAIDDISFREVNSFNGSVVVNLDIPSIGSISLDKEYLCNTEGDRNSLIASCSSPFDGIWSITPTSVAHLSNPQQGSLTTPSTVSVVGNSGIVGNATLTYTTQPSSNGCTNSTSIPIDLRECCENPCYWNTLGNTDTKPYNFIGPINRESFRIRTNNVERMVVHKDGNVGIGTLSPNALLHVSKQNGTMGLPYEIAAFESSGDTKFGVYSSTSETPNGTKGASLTLGYSNSTTLDGNYPGYEMQFVGLNNDPNEYYLRFNWIERDNDGYVVGAIPNVMTMLNNGNVGVNTASPSAKFHTNGSVRFESLEENCGDFLVINKDGYVYRKSVDCNTFEKNNKINELETKLKNQQQEIEELKTQVKALLELKNYSFPNKTELIISNKLEIIPTPFSSNAKVVYELSIFNGDEQLQILDISGKLLKSFNVSQQKGQIEIGLITSSSSTVFFNIVSKGNVIVSKKSIKTNL